MAYDPIDHLLAGRAFHISAVIDADPTYGPNNHTCFGLMLPAVATKFAVITHANLSNSGYAFQRAFDARFFAGILGSPRSSPNGGYGQNKRPGAAASQVRLWGGTTTTNQPGTVLTEEIWLPAHYNRFEVPGLPILLTPGSTYWFETAENNVNLVGGFHWTEHPLAELP